MAYRKKTMTKIRLSKKAQRTICQINDLGVQGNISSQQLGKEVTHLKELAINNRQEGLANIYWCVERVYRLKTLYLKGRAAIKKKDYLTGWSKLVSAENLSFTLLRLSPPELTNFTQVNKLKNLVRCTMFLYPFLYPDYPPVFASSGFIHKSWECSICAISYKIIPKCKHRPGFLYMGQLCARKITDSILTEVAMVGNPRHKNCIMHSVGGKHFNEKFDFQLLNELIERTSPLQDWAISNIDAMECGKLKTRHFDIKLSNLDIYGNNLKQNKRAYSKFI